MKKALVAGLLGAGLSVGATCALAATAVKIDPDHTSATFTIAHLTITKVSGQIPLISSHVEVNEKGIPTAAAATFDLTKIETQDEHRDTDLRGDKWFDTAHYPTMVFRSTVITPGVGNAFTMKGTLTMHGKTEPVTLDGTFSGKAMFMGHTHLGYSATGTIDRTLWDVGNAPAAIVGNDVTINIQAEAIQN
jgi:polyisoprenoid-binding protein YceI